MTQPNAGRQVVQAALEHLGSVDILVTNAGGPPKAAFMDVTNQMWQDSIRPGLMALANSLSREVADDGVTVNVVMPGSINTERLGQLGLNMKQLVDAIPAGRLGEADEFAAMCAFLASEPARYITGQALACDGGRRLGI